MIKNEVKPIKIERTVKPKEITILKEVDEAQRIDISKEEEPIIIQQVENIETKDNTNSVIQEINNPKKETQQPIVQETHYMNVNQQEAEITHYKIFQEKAISQEEFTKKTTFTTTMTQIQIIQNNSKDGKHYS
jgi:nitrate reductase cytochrome c-type subunit